MVLSSSSPLSSSRRDDLVDVVFLDIDGVLLPFGDDMEPKSACGAIFPDSTLSALSYVIKQTGAKLVLSSTWRARNDFVEQILDSFREYSKKNGGGLRNIEKFHDMTDLGYHGERQWEIYGWLQQNSQNVRAWVALDDEELLEGYENVRYHAEFVGHVVMTDSRKGLTLDDAKNAVLILQRQIRQYKQRHVHDSK